ncbi:MAG: hypothetical protein ABI992_07555 [Chthoniobacterales bacterium]
MNRIYRFLSLAGCIAALALTSCQTAGHQFASPAASWQTKTGQLSYQGRKISLIGEVLVRYSPKGEMEFSFSKGPGVNLLFVRQDAKFASAHGPLSRGGWSGPSASAPARLRGWFSLREQILAGHNSIKTNVDGEKFNLRF